MKRQILLVLVMMLCTSFAHADFLQSLEKLSQTLDAIAGQPNPASPRTTDNSMFAGAPIDDQLRMVTAPGLKVSGAPTSLGEVMLHITVTERGTKVAIATESLYIIQGARRTNFWKQPPQGDRSTFRSSTNRCNEYWGCTLDPSQPEYLLLTNLPDWFDKTQPFKVSYQGNSPFELRFNEPDGGQKPMDNRPPRQVKIEDAKAGVAYTIIVGGTYMMEILVEPSKDGVPFRFSRMILVQGETDSRLTTNGGGMRWSSSKEDCLPSYATCTLYGPVRFRMQVSPSWFDPGKPFKIIREGDSSTPPINILITSS